MPWTSYLDHPDPLIAVFGALPEGKVIELEAIRLERGGTLIELDIDLDEYPQHPPEKWKKEGNNTVRCVLDVLDGKKLVIDGWRPQTKGTCEIKKEGETLVFSFTSPGCAITIDAAGIYVESVSAYIKNEDSAC